MARSIPRWVGRDIGRIVDVIKTCQHGIEVGSAAMTSDRALTSLSDPIIRSIKSSETLDDFPSTSSAMLSRVYLEVRPSSEQQGN